MNSKTLVTTVSVQLVPIVLCAADKAAMPARPDLAVPRLRMTLEGPMAQRLDGIIRNWLIPEERDQTRHQRLQLHFTSQCHAHLFERAWGAVNHLP